MARKPEPQKGGEETVKKTYTPKEVAHLLGVHLMTVYKLVRSGELPSFRLGRKILIPRHAISRLLGEE